MIPLRQYAVVTPKLGPFLNNEDADTEETELDIVQADVRLSKNHSAFEQKSDVNAGTPDEKGYYSIPLNAVDTDTLGHMRVSIHVVGALVVWEDFWIFLANVYDAFFGTSLLSVDVTTAQGVITDAIDDLNNIDTNAVQVAATAAIIAAGLATTDDVNNTKDVIVNEIDRTGKGPSIIN